tara:strand:+ start:2838 stop:3167 length:330 start_codon:yes stop_codon:yes gene_type:complete
MVKENMVIYVDFDETIARTSIDRDYASSEPIHENIDMVNTLYDKGHTIIYWTARGTLKKDNYFKVTLNQLDKWGCKYHELRMGKPYYDLFIDDKNLNVKDLHNYIKRSL